MYRGEYTKNNFNGLKTRYQFGDITSFEGKLYKCEKSTEFSPFQDSKSWSFTGTFILFSSDTAPLNASEGQLWERNGVIYTYYFDGDNYSWVEF